MSQEQIFLQNILRSGSDVIINSSKWSIEAITSLTLTAKQSGAKLTLRHASSLLRTVDKSKIESLAINGKGSIIFDFSE